MIRPLRDVVVIRRAAPDAVSSGGIHLAWDADYKEDIGEVVAVGDGRKCGICKATSPIEVKPGDIVLFSTHGHQITTIKGEELIITKEASLIAVLDSKRNVESGTYKPERRYAGLE